MILAPDFINNCSTSAICKLKVIVIGCGGTGSELVSKLFKMDSTVRALGGAGFDVYLVDDDVVSPSNIGRQNFWECDIGQPKASVLARRFNVFGGTNYKAVVERFSDRDFRNCVVFGCVDNAQSRKLIHKAFKKKGHNVVWIDCGNDSASSHVVMGINAFVNNESVYIPSVYDLFKKQLNNDRRKDEPSCSTQEAIVRQDLGINDATAQQAVQMLWQLYRHGQISYHGTVLDLRQGSCTPIAADPDIWAMFGYSVKLNKKAA